MAERPLQPASGRDDLLAVLLALAIALATVIVGALAAGGERKDAAPSATISPERDPACAEWTDGCVVCQRTAQRPACSTPGIACTRGATTCLRR